MTGRTWGAALTTGLAAGALGLVFLLGAVLHSAAAPLDGNIVSWKDAPAQLHRAAPIRARDGAPDKDGQPREPRPPVRLWRGPSLERHPPRPRKALA